MSVHRKDKRWVVRWREGDRQRSRSFTTKREAVEFDRIRQRDSWRDLIALPKGAVPAEAADTGTTFLVSEDLWNRPDTTPSFLRDLPSAQRPIHSGYFRTIREADAYRRQMPDADALSIALLYDRFPLRNLSDDEIAAREVSEGDHERAFKAMVADRTRRSIKAPDGTRTYQAVRR